MLRWDKQIAPRFIAVGFAPAGSRLAVLYTALFLGDYIRDIQHLLLLDFHQVDDVFCFHNKIRFIDVPVVIGGVELSGMGRSQFRTSSSDSNTQASHLSRYNFAKRSGICCFKVCFLLRHLVKKQGRSFYTGLLGRECFIDRSADFPAAHLTVLESQPACGLQPNVLIRTILHNPLAKRRNLRIVFLHILLPSRNISVTVSRQEQRIHELVEQFILYFLS